MSLLIKNRPLLFSPELARRVGLNEAIALQQVAYWVRETESGVDYDGKRWIYNTYASWSKQFPFWSEDTIKRTMQSLKNHGLILVEQLNKAQHDRTNFYTIDEGSIHLIDEGKTAPSTRAQSPVLHTEITTETTTKNSSHQQAADEIPYDKIFDSFEKILPEKPKVQVRDEKRKKKVKAFWTKSKKRQSLEWWASYWSSIRESNFLLTTRTLGIDWFLKDDNFKKVAEGNYSNA